MLQSFHVIHPLLGLQGVFRDGLRAHVTAEYATHHIIVTQRLVQPEKPETQDSKADTISTGGGGALDAVL